MAPVVTISACFGAGGSIVGPAVAERLRLPFLDRAIPAEVARRLKITPEEALARDEQAEGRVARLLRAIVPIMGPVGPEAVPAELPGESRAFREKTEEVLRRAADTTGGVILGRAAMVVLGDREDVLKVRLDGPASARIAQARKREPQMSEEEARSLQRQFDRTRESYARVFYNASQSDPRLYHLIIDSTAVPLEACVDIVVAAARGRLPLGPSGPIR